MSILSFVQDLIEQQIAEYQKQHGNTDGVLQMIMNAHAPLADKAWIGNGQKAYLQDALKLFQAIKELMAIMQLYTKGIETAFGIINVADRQTRDIANRVADVFDKVF
jgi:uncharacterized protein YukE